MNRPYSVSPLPPWWRAARFWPAFLSRADEGMWTFDNPPLKQLQEKVSLHADQGVARSCPPVLRALERRRIGIVRQRARSAADQSSRGARPVAEELDQRARLHPGRLLRRHARPGDEVAGPRSQRAGFHGKRHGARGRALKTAKTAEEEFAARKAAIAGIERESQQKTGLRSDVVTLYNAGNIGSTNTRSTTTCGWCLRRRSRSLSSAAIPTTFTYPRYDLDMALFRVYENGRPLDTKDYLKWNPQGAADHELVFVPGHPGSTARLDTMGATRVSARCERAVHHPRSQEPHCGAQRVLGAGPEQARQAPP